MKTFVFEYYRYQLVPKSTVQLSVDIKQQKHNKANYALFV